MLTSKRTRIPPDERKGMILDGAMRLAEEKGYTNFSSPELSRACGCGHPLIFHYFASMTTLRSELMRKAVVEKNLIVIGQGIANKDIFALDAPESLKRKAIKALNN